MSSHFNGIDLSKLRRMSSETADSIRALKRLLRTTWTRPMATEQRSLASLKRRATSLCITRALLRGRSHLKRPTEELVGLAEQAIDRYGLLGAQP